MSKKNKNKYQQQHVPPSAPVAAAPVAPKPEAPGGVPPAPEAPVLKAESLITLAKGLFGMTGAGAAQPEAANATAPLEARLEDALAKAQQACEDFQKQKEQAEAARQASEAERVRQWTQKLELDARKESIDQEQQAVLLREQAVEAKEQAASQWEQRLAQKESVLKHEESRLLQEREALKTRELNAEAGFAQQRRHSLEQLEQESKALHQQLSEQRERIASERAAWEKERAEAREKLEAEQREKRTAHEAGLQKEAAAQGQKLRQERAEHENTLRQERTAHDEQLLRERAEHESRLRQERSAQEQELRQERTAHEDTLRQERYDQEALLQEERRKLDERRAQLDKDKSELAAERRKLEGDREDVREEREYLKTRAEKLAAGRVEELQHQCSALEERLKEAQRERDRLSGVLIQREEMDRRFEHQTPEEVLRELQALREKRDELGKQLAARPGAEAAERLQALVAEKDRWEQDRTRLYQENQSLKYELARQRVAVVEIETLRDQKAALESSRELLHATLEKLRNEVKDLISRSDGKTPFPSLTEMDTAAELQSPIPMREEPPKLADFVQEIQYLITEDPEARKEGKKLIYPPEVIRSFLGGLAMSPLLLLQGISGTGKTTLPLAFARAIGAGSEVIEVQAGWRDKNDLIGHFNAFERTFHEESFLQALYRARCPRYRDVPFLIVLDEMNLSHPEQYFAELLSAMEREVGGQKLRLMTAPVNASPEGLEEKGTLLALPRNVWFIGTANHDETTKDFADKTYDRAHVMEFHGAQRQELPAKRYERSQPLSLQALRKAFGQAQEQHQGQAKRAHEFLRKELSELLKSRFRIGMSNRLERQLNAYVPVIIAAGGSLGEAVDHVLATKLLRKLRNQHETRPEDLLKLREQLETRWSRPMDGHPGPMNSLSLIKDLLKRLGKHDGDQAA
jgi:hypothetical protein